MHFLMLEKLHLVVGELVGKKIVILRPRAKSSADFTIIRDSVHIRPHHKRLGSLGKMSQKEAARKFALQLHIEKG